MCIAHWLLGIGDRHLENSLLSLKDGKIVGIDFGHAFGTATQRLPVPELVPFRLTAFITNLLEPLGKQGLFRETMVKILKAFRFVFFEWMSVSVIVFVGKTARLC